jgi:hypothetical protein
MEEYHEWEQFRNTSEILVEKTTSKERLIIQSQRKSDIEQNKRFR